MHEKEAKQLERNLAKREVIKSPEVWGPLFSVITISGPSGVGKTKVAEFLAKRYGIPEDRFIKTGRILRELAGDATGYIKRPISVDRKLDSRQVEIVRTARVEKPVILEGRLAGVIASEERRKARKQGADLPVVSVLLTASSRIRHRRILTRDKERNPSLTLREVKSLTQEREIGDRGRWKEVHPELIKGDPFLPSNIDRDGNPIYDAVISTSRLPVEGVAETIHRFLVDGGWVRRKT